MTILLDICLNWGDIRGLAGHLPQSECYAESGGVSGIYPNQGDRQKVSVYRFLHNTAVGKEGSSINECTPHLLPQVLT
jgi:hypothetical protein